MNIPLKLAQNDSATWRDNSTVDNLGNPITPAEWTLKYAIRGPVTLDLTATVDGDSWSTNLTLVNSATLTPGLYFWQAFVVDDPVTPTKRVTLSSGQIEITTDLNTASGVFDGRSQAEKDLAAVDAAITAIASGGMVQRYTIANRSVDKMPMDDLIKLRSLLKYRVSQEKRLESIKNGLGDPRNLSVRFK